MMEKIKKPIIHSAEDKVLNIDQKDIQAGELFRDRYFVP